MPLPATMRQIAAREAGPPEVLALAQAPLVRAEAAALVAVLVTAAGFSIKIVESGTT